MRAPALSFIPFLREFLRAGSRVLSPYLRSSPDSGSLNGLGEPLCAPVFLVHRLRSAPLLPALLSLPPCASRRERERERKTEGKRARASERIPRLPPAPKPGLVAGVGHRSAARSGGAEGAAPNWTGPEGAADDCPLRAPAPPPARAHFPPALLRAPLRRFEQGDPHSRGALSPPPGAAPDGGLFPPFPAKPRQSHGGEMRRLLPRPSPSSRRALRGLAKLSGSSGKRLPKRGFVQLC